MPDHLIRAQVALHRMGGLPEDSVTNTLYFDADDSGPSWVEHAEGLASRLEDFYVSVGALMLASSLSGLGTIKFTDVRDPKPQLPKLTHEFVFAPVSGEKFPGEVALCLSFKAASASGQNPKRRRGRIYVGPLAAMVGDSISTASELRPEGGFCQQLADLGLELATGTDGAARHAVFSPRTAVTEPIDDAFNDVEDYWVDNAFDTQRSRGAAPMVRYSANVVG